MNYLVLLIVLLFLSTLGHAFLLSKRISRRVVPLLIPQSSGSIDPLVHSAQRASDNMRILLTSIFFLGPLLLYRSLNELSIENTAFNFSGMVFLVTLSIVGLWFSVYKLRAEEFGYKTSTLESETKRIDFLVIKEKTNASTIENESGTKLTAKKLASIKKNRIDAKNLKVFKNLLDKLDIFKYWLPEFEQFELSNFKTYKNRRITTKQAWFTFIVCYHEEVLKTRLNSGKLKGGYYDILNSRFFIKTAKINRQDWLKFREEYIDNGGIQDLKTSEFYKELRGFVLNNTKM